METVRRLMGSRWARAGAFAVAGLLAMKATARVVSGRRVDLALRDVVLALGALALARLPDAAVADAPRALKVVPRAFGWTSPIPASIH